MGQKRHRNKDQREPPRCPLCDVALDEQARCAECGARLLAPAQDDAPPRLELSGTASATLTQPLADDARGAPPWQHTHDLALRTGRTVRLLTGARTEICCDPALVPARAHAAEAAARGELSAGFSEHHGGLRDAAAPELLLRASAIAFGPGAAARLQRRLEHHDLLSDAAAHSMAGAEKHERKHTDDLRFSERERAGGRWEVTVRWGRGSSTNVLLTLFFVGQIAYFGAMFAGQVGRTAGPWSFYYLLTIALTAIAGLGALAAMLTYFRRSELVLDPDTLHTRDLPLPWPTARERALPVSELSHLVWRGDALYVARFDGEEHALLPWADNRDLRFMDTLLQRRLELACRKEPERALPPRTAAGRLWGRVPPPLRLASYALVTLLAVPLLGTLACPFAPGCMLTGLRPVWLEARRLANACPAVTERLGENITWAFGEAFTDHLEDGHGWFAVKGDKRRGKMTLSFSLPVSAGVRLRDVTIAVDGEKICAIHCVVFGEDPDHPR